jgi:hypothetical protein
MSRKFHLIAPALAAVAVAAPIAHANTAPSPRAKVDPLAVSYLRAKGLSPSQIKAWTVGVCSHGVKPAACYAPSKGAALTSSRAKVDPLAVSYLRAKGLSPSQIKAWTVGACSHGVKPAACFQGSERTATPAQTVQSGRFDWADAGIGAGATLGVVLLLSGLGVALVMSRQGRRRQAPSM